MIFKRKLSKKASSASDKLAPPSPQGGAAAASRGDPSSTMDSQSSVDDLQQQMQELWQQVATLQRQISQRTAAAAASGTSQPKPDPTTTTITYPTATTGTTTTAATATSVTTTAAAAGQLTPPLPRSPFMIKRQPSSGHSRTTSLLSSSATTQPPQPAAAAAPARSPSRSGSLLSSPRAQALQQLHPALQLALPDPAVSPQFTSPPSSPTAATYHKPAVPSTPASPRTTILPQSPRSPTSRPAATAIVPETWEQVRTRLLQQVCGSQGYVRPASHITPPFLAALLLPCLTSRDASQQRGAAHVALELSDGSVVRGLSLRGKLVAAVGVLPALSGLLSPFWEPEVVTAAARALADVCKGPQLAGGRQEQGQVAAVGTLPAVVAVLERLVAASRFRTGTRSSTAVGMVATTLESPFAAAAQGFRQLDTTVTATVTTSTSTSKRNGSTTAATTSGRRPAALRGDEQGELYNAAFGLLMALCAGHEGNKRQAATAGAIPAIATLLADPPQYIPGSFVAAARALAMLCSGCKANQRQAAAAGVLPALVNNLQRQDDGAFYVPDKAAAAQALAAVCDGNTRVQAEAADCGAVAALLQLLHDAVYGSVAKRRVGGPAAGALAALCGGPNGGCGQQAVAAGAVPLLLKGFELVWPSRASVQYEMALVAVGAVD